MRPAGKVAAITGGARGIGHSTAVKFAAEGAKVAGVRHQPGSGGMTL